MTINRDLADLVPTLKESGGNLLVGITSSSTGKVVVKQSASDVASGISLQASADDSSLRIWNSGSVFNIDAYYDLSGSYQPIAFRNGNGERMRIVSTGELLVGKTTVTANGGVLQVSNGITFPATQSACSDVNTLDDYEEGSWTASVGGTATYNSQTGTYVKIGKLVILRIQFEINVLGTGSASTISGLPFSCTASGEGSVSYFDLSASLVNITPFVDTNQSTSVRFRTLTAAATSPGTAGIFQNGARVDFTLIYQS